MIKYQWDIYIPSGILGQEKHESPKCLIEIILPFSFVLAEFVLYVLFSKKLLKMRSKRFYTAEEVGAILVMLVMIHKQDCYYAATSSLGNLK